MSKFPTSVTVAALCVFIQDLGGNCHQPGATMGILEPPLIGQRRWRYPNFSTPRRRIKQSAINVPYHAPFWFRIDSYLGRTNQYDSK
ncbi:hypothetical protein VTO42DRAFT_4021 [Malbranchea cinnamomea]